MARGRKRIDLESKGEKILHAAIAQGSTVDQFVADLRASGIEISRRAAASRLAERRGRLKSPRVDRKKTSKLPIGALPPKQPTALDLENLDKADPMTLDQWAKWVERAAKRAAADGNLPMVGTMITRAVAIEEARRKARPPPAPNPDDDPDLRALGASTWSKVLLMVEQLEGVAA